MAWGENEMNFRIVGRDSGHNGPYTLEELIEMESLGEISSTTELRETETGRTIRLGVLLGQEESRGDGEFLANRDESQFSSNQRSFGWWLSRLAVMLVVCVSAPALVFGPTAYKNYKEGLSKKNLVIAKRLGTGLLSYAADHDDTLPPYMREGGEMYHYVMMYVDVTGFLDPRYEPRPVAEHGGMFLGNQNLHAKKVSSFDNPDTLILFHETKSWENGSILIQLLNGSTRYVRKESLSDAIRNGYRFR